MPFRFGVVTLTEAPQAFVRARIRLADGREGWGAGAELLAPKWFDKNLALSNEENFEQLRNALRLARDAYLDGKSRTAFGHFAAHYGELIEVGDAARLESTRRVLRPGAARPRDPRCAVPAVSDVVLRGDPGKLRGHCRSGAHAGARRLRHRYVPRALAAGGHDRGAPYRRTRGRDRRPSAAGQ